MNLSPLFLLPILLLNAGLCSALQADENLIPNGDFELGDLEWQCSNAKVVPSPSGSGSALFVAAGGRLETTKIPASQQLTIEFDFASERPSAAANGFIVDLRAGGPPVIRLQFMAGGKLAVCSTDAIGYPLEELAFSLDSDENGSLADSADTAAVHRVRIEHNGSQDEPSFNITITDANGRVRSASGLTSYHDPSLAGKRLYHLLFIVPEATAGVMIDNVVVTQ